MSEGSELSQRQQDARRRLEMEASAVRNEAAAAQVLLDEFVAAAQAEGLSPEPLMAMLLQGKRVKSNRVGWYLNRARTVAVTPEGHFLQLLTTGSKLARFTGVTLEPSLPGLEIGKGGKDGETGPLKDFLERTLDDYRGRR